MAKHNKYKLRPDGRRETTKTYPSGKKHFYGRTDEEIDRKIAAYEAELEKAGEQPVHLFSEIADIYMERQEKELSPNSVCGYRTAKNRAVEIFGTYYVDEITPQMVLSYLNRYKAQGYSSKVITNSKIVLKGILDLAFADGEISSNPCANLPPVKGKPKQKRHAAEEEDLRRIEETKTQDNFARMSYFMQYTGCRRGEAAALQQKNIDRQNKKARICQAVAYSDTRKPILKPPKSEAGFRDVDLYDNVLAIIPEYEDDETFIFFPEGLPTKTQLESGLKAYQQRNGISATAHMLRHSYASMLHSAKVDVKDAQTLLGHSSVLMTEDIYTELEKEHRNSLRDEINDYVMNTRLQPKSSKKSSE